jgi:ribulose-phosphate 3-epimerase
VSWSSWTRGPEVLPSLYAANFARLGEEIERLAQAGARLFHYDVGDGQFIEPITIGPIVLESVSPLLERHGALVDAHLMTIEPEKHFEQLARAGASSVTFHVEAVDDPPRAVARAHALGLGVGIAFNPQTPVSAAVAASDGVDLVLCMSINPGYSGQAFMPEALERIAELRSELPAHVHIQVDGGVKPDNIAALRTAGADLLVVGSGIFAASDIGEAYRTLAGQAVAVAA